ncbi:MAG: arsenate reductase family protein [Bacteroidota bacterium]
MVTLYGIPNCNQIRKTRSWLDEREIPFRFVDLKKEPLSREELREMAEKVGLDLLINRRGMKWRQLGLAKKELSEGQLFEQLFEHQVMIKRPLLVKGKTVHVGFDEEALSALVQGTNGQ